MGIQLPGRGRDGAMVYLFENLHAVNTRETTIRFALWAAQCRDLNAQRVQQFLGCSRASAYRYLAAFRSARGEA